MAYLGALHIKAINMKKNEEPMSQNTRSQKCGL